jgi:hypothetical protein
MPARSALTMCLQEFPVQISDPEIAVPGRQSPSAQSAPARLGGSEYAELSRLVREAGLLHRRTLYYTWKIVATVGALSDVVGSHGRALNRGPAEA